jgi:hypothetical protein
VAESRLGKRPPDFFAAKIDVHISMASTELRRTAFNKKKPPGVASAALESALAVRAATGVESRI